jgi:hypothetical protein
LKKREKYFFGEGQGEMVFPHPNPLPELSSMYLILTVAGRGDFS